MTDIALLKQRLGELRRGWESVGVSDVVAEEIAKIDGTWVGVTKTGISRFLSLFDEALSGIPDDQPVLDFISTKRIHDLTVVITRLGARLPDFVTNPPGHVAAVMQELTAIRDQGESLGIRPDAGPNGAASFLERQVPALAQSIKEALDTISRATALTGELGTVASDVKAKSDEILAQQKKAKDRAELADKAASASATSEAQISEVSQRAAALLDQISKTVSASDTSKASLDELVARGQELRNQLQALIDDRTKKLTDLEAKAKTDLKTLRENKEKQLEDLRVERAKSLDALHTEHSEKLEKARADGVARLNLLEATGKGKIEALLEAATRVGLAKSFEDAAAKQRNTAVVFGLAFCAGLFGMGFVGIEYVFPLLKNSSGAERLLNVLSGAVLSSPAVWLAWVAAVRLSDAVRQMGDYRFKAAAALALDGYKKEAEEADPTLKTELLRIAILHFGRSPNEIERSEPVSPVDSFIDRLLKKKAYGQGTDVDAKAKAG
jgi:hypothetical protein